MMKCVGLSDWFQYVQEGRQYLETALGGRKRAAVFNNELLGNLIGLSLEKLLLGLCLRYGYMPTDHTLSGIVAEAKQHCSMENSLAEEILLLDRLQDLCSLDVHMPCAPSDQRIESLLRMNARVAAYVEESIK